MKDELKDIKKMIDELLVLQDNYLAIIRYDIDYIISNEVVDDDKVAGIFDELLSLLQTDEVLNLYKKLCRYYYFVNSELVVEYVDFYKEMYIDASIDSKVKEKNIFNDI
ncbi:MAG: hypothetical protein IJ068_02195 [Bacilli bacterium]|nr:hypothetical protein [Bacilli bacterium]